MAGFFTYVKFLVRRERVISSLWIGLTVVLSVLIAMIFPSLLSDDPVARTAMLEMLKSPAMVGMLGPVFGTESYTVSILFAQMMTVWCMITAAVMNIFFVVRHTRADEELGRLELMRSFPLGRLTPAAATLAGAVVLNVLIAVMTAVLLLPVGLEGTSAAGAFSYAFSIAGFGVVMAASALLFSQVFSTSRAALGASFGVLGLFYLLRLAGDYTDNFLSYLSPMGLGMRVYAFYENNLLPIVVLFVLGAAIGAAALYFYARRDIGEGMIAARKGRSEAKQSLLSPLGYVLKLTRNTALVWCLVVFVIAAMYGSMLGDIESFVQSNDFYKQMLQYDESTASSLTESFLAMLFMVMAHICVIPILMLAGKLRSEESHGRLEQILARSVRRTELLALTTAVACIGSVLMILSMTLGLYATSVLAEPIAFGTFLLAGINYLPAVLVFAGLAIFLTGFLPRGGIISWSLFAYSFGVVYMGRLLKLPDFLQRLSPIGLTAQLPVQDFHILTPILLLMAAAALIGGGIWRFARRDIVA